MRSERALPTRGLFFGFHGQCSSKFRPKREIFLVRRCGGDASTKASSPRKAEENSTFGKNAKAGHPPTARNRSCRVFWNVCTRCDRHLVRAFGVA